jgi:hypothetical protein
MTLFVQTKIRAGAIGRDEALALVARDNQARFQSIREYADLIGLRGSGHRLRPEALLKLYRDDPRPTDRDQMGKA